MTGQVDLRVEADNLARLRRNFGDGGGVVFPQPLPGLSGEKVLVESYEAGVHVAEFVEQLLACQGDEGAGQEFRTTRRAVASAGVDMLLKMVRKSSK